MQNSQIFKYMTWALKGFLVLSFILAIFQNYISHDGQVEFFGITLTQFYAHTERRIFPLVLASFFLIKVIKRFLHIEDNFFFSDFILALLCGIDAFTHVNGYYNVSYTFPYLHKIWFDKIAHFLEGLMLLPAIMPLFYCYLQKHIKAAHNKALSYFITIGACSIFFILWEILEAIMDISFGTRLVTSVYDTNIDLLFAYVGFSLSLIIMEGWYAYTSFLRYQINLIRQSKISIVTKTTSQIGKLHNS